ncbi:unnamed protein product [Phytomonas sp. Hart1]|nr:unnamed protein product [Phytomonas sp. Hart1]|eukprot:CCW66083.1 unnamed protein product [Phytomonas sp. isolate Hart1]
MFRSTFTRLPPKFNYAPLIPKVSHANTKYRLLSKDHVSVVKPGNGLPDILKVEPQALSLLTSAAFDDIEHLLRPSHLACLRRIFDDPEASDNDRFVALQFLKNACISAGRILPGCQDTGTAIIAGYRGEQVYVTGNDEEAISRGVFDIFQQRNLRFSQIVPVGMFDEKNTGTNLPAQIDLYATKGMEYTFFLSPRGVALPTRAFFFRRPSPCSTPNVCAYFYRKSSPCSGRQPAPLIMSPL